MLSVLCKDDSNGPSKKLGKENPRWLLPDLVQIILEYLLWSNFEPRLPWIKTTTVDLHFKQNFQRMLIRGDGVFYDTATAPSLLDHVEKLPALRESKMNLKEIFDLLKIDQPILDLKVELPVASKYQYCGVCNSYSVINSDKMHDFNFVHKKFVDSKTQMMIQIKSNRTLLSCYHDPTSDSKDVHRYLMQNTQNKQELILVSHNVEKSSASSSEIVLEYSWGERVEAYINGSRKDNNGFVKYSLVFSQNAKWVTVNLLWTNRRLCSMMIRGSKCLIEMVGEDEHFTQFASSLTHCWVVYSNTAICSFAWNEDPLKIIYQFPSFLFKSKWDIIDDLFPLPSIQGLAILHRKGNKRKLTVVIHPRFYVSRRIPNISPIPCKEHKQNN
jgi:hypothetical protein